MYCVRQVVKTQTTFLNEPVLQLVAIYNTQLHVSALYVGHHEVVQRTYQVATHILYGHLISSLDNLMMAYIQGRNMQLYLIYCY